MNNFVTFTSKEKEIPIRSKVKVTGVWEGNKSLRISHYHFRDYGLKYRLVSLNDQPTRTWLIN